MARTSTGRGRGRGRGGRVGVQHTQNPQKPIPKKQNATTNTSPIPSPTSNDSIPSQSPLTTPPPNNIPVFKGPMGSDASHGIGKQLRLDSGGNLRQLSSSTSTDNPNPISVPSTAVPSAPVPSAATPSTTIPLPAIPSTALPSKPIGGKGKCRISVPENPGLFFPSVKIPGVRGATGGQSGSGGHSASGGRGNSASGRGGQSASVGDGEAVTMGRGRGTTNKPVVHGRGRPSVCIGGQRTTQTVLGRDKQTGSVGLGRGGVGRGRGTTCLPVSRHGGSSSLQMGRGNNIQRVGSSGGQAPSVGVGEGIGQSGEQRQGQTGARRDSVSEGGERRVSGQGGYPNFVEGSGSHSHEQEGSLEQRQENSVQNEEQEVPEHIHMEPVPNQSDIRGSQESQTSGTSKKLKIWLENGRTILPSEEASYVITKTFQRRVDETGYNWKGVTQKTKNLYFEEFLKNVEYDPRIEHALYRPWHSKAGVRYKDFVSKHKDQQEEYIDDATWARWNQYWETEEFKIKSFNGKKNRKGKDENPSKHSAGSVTFRKTWERMNVQQKRTVSAPEMYISTHKRKETEEYVDAKAQGYGEELETRLSQLDPTLSEQEALRKKNEIFLEVVGPPRKGRYYGTDPVILGDLAGTSSGHSNASTNETQDEMRQRLEEVEAKERENAQEVLRLKKLNSTLRSKLPGFIRQLVNKAIQSTYDTGEGDAQMNEQGDDADNELDKAFDDMMIEEEADDVAANATADGDNPDGEELNDWEHEHVESL